MAGGGGGGEETEEEFIDPELDFAESRAVQFKYDTHSPDADNIKRQLDGFGRRVMQWRDTLKDSQEFQRSQPRMSAQIFKEMVEARESMQRYAAETIQIFEDEFRKRWGQAHPRSAEIRHTYFEILKALELLISTEVVEDEGDQTMGQQETVVEHHFHTTRGGGHV